VEIARRQIQDADVRVTRTESGRPMVRDELSLAAWQRLSTESNRESQRARSEEKIARTQASTHACVYPSINPRGVLTNRFDMNRRVQRRASLAGDCERTRDRHGESQNRKTRKWRRREGFPRSARDKTATSANYRADSAIAPIGSSRDTRLLRAAPPAGRDVISSHAGPRVFVTHGAK
jgi:hypothetical protein